jgi:subtilisin family serine protease
MVVHSAHLRSSACLRSYLLVTALLLPPAVVSGTETTESVRIPTGPASASQKLALAELPAIDYGSFRWMELRQPELELLAGTGLEFEITDGRTIVVPGYRFDPLRGEPVLPAKLLSTAGGPGLRLVQLAGPTKGNWLTRLEALGLRILQYYPHNTYLVWDERAAESQVKALSFVRWQGRFHPAYKIDPGLIGKNGPIHRVDVLLYDDGSLENSLATIAAVVTQISAVFPARPDRSHYHVIAELDPPSFDTADLDNANLDTSGLAEIARMESAIWIGHQASQVELFDEMSDAVVAGNHTDGFPEPGYREWLAELGYDGSGVIWSIVDSGVNPDHPDLELVGGYSHGSCTAIPGDDTSGHGTSVAGIVSGTGTTGYADDDGFLYGLGVAPGAMLQAQNACFLEAGYPPSGGWQELSRRAVLAGASGSNNSWGSPEWDGYLAVSQIYDQMVRDGNFDTPQTAEPHTVVFSIGNEGAQRERFFSTAEAKNVILVGATENRRRSPIHRWTLGDINKISDTSSRGPTSDGRIAPTVVAPGYAVTTSINDDSNDGGGVELNDTDGLYGIFSGTSSASPHVSGAVAVITEWWRASHRGADPSPAMARALLVNSAVKATPNSFIPNSNEGWGRIHLGQAIRPDAPRVLLDQRFRLTETGARTTVEVSIPDPLQPVKVTIAWTDAAGAIGASPALVNDLDLTVETGGTTYLGNAFRSGWSSTVDANPDRLNNLENVYLVNFGSEATITITAAQLAGDGVPYNRDSTDQDFALVCCNCELKSRATRRPSRRAGFADGS